MKILGLDLGVGSVGWALIETDNDKKPQKILGIGSRIINLTPDESKNFDRGAGETICGQRTAMRTARKGNHRYKMRHRLLDSVLQNLGMQVDNDTSQRLSPLQLWKMRSDAASIGHRLELAEIGRVLKHLNQKRGYRHAKTDISNSKQSEYVSKVNANFETIKSLNHTVGQYFYKTLISDELKTENGRIRNNIFPRKAYEDEFDCIMSVQRVFYPQILTDENIAELKNAIFYQRPLKSCKHLVSTCDFEKLIFKNKSGKDVVVGPKVAPRTSPLAQITRIYEAINNIRLVNPANRKNKLPDDLPNTKEARKLCHEYSLTPREKADIFEYLNTHERMTGSDLLKILGLKKSDGFKPDQLANKGIKGNDTYIKLKNALYGLANVDDFLKFDVKIIDSNQVDTDTGEIIQIISPDYINEPLYRLWHIVYSISTKEELAKALHKSYGINDPKIIEQLFAIDFTTPGFSNRSAKFMRKLLPYLMQGYMYNEACSIIGVNHSNSLTVEQNKERELKKRLELLPKNSLRQPIVEKILNQMINVVNALLNKYGEIDEVRIELARSLKQSAKERGEASKDIAKREKENETIAKRISEEYHITPSRRKIQKYRMWEETCHTCIYCGQPVGVCDFLNGADAEVEHIIPRSIFFDDSFSNKTCACRNCNHKKDNKTAYDFMASQSESALDSYIARVEQLYADNKISKTKRNRLLTSKDDIPEDFLNRDLRLTQYITKKSLEILHDVVRNVWASSGSVTDFFRHNWGYDTILHDSNIERYQLADKVSEIQYEHKGQVHSRLQIDNWSKRLDHRHHAIDALTVALTQQAFVQRLSNLNREHGNLYDDIVNQGESFKRDESLLQEWAACRPHFTVNDVRTAIDNIAVSFKTNKVRTTPGKRSIRKQGKKLIIQQGLTIPRGSLHQESIYGKSLIYDGEKLLKEAFKNPGLICDKNIREMVLQRIADANNDIKLALKNLKKSPLTIIRHGEKVELTKIKCFREEFVIKYPIDSIRLKDIAWIVDEKIREIVRARFLECDNNDKAFVQSIAERPLRLSEIHAPIRSVKCMTGLDPQSMVSVRKDGEGNIIGYAKGGSNHHVAFYLDSNGKIQTMVTTFWTSVQRRLAGIDPIVSNPAKAWDKLQANTNETLCEQIAQTLPLPDWNFVSSMQRGNMFILGLSEDQINDAIATNDTKTLSQHLYRVQKLSYNDYCFRFHTDTTSDDSKDSINMKKYIRAKSYSTLAALNPHKVNVTVLGDINL